MLTQQSVKKAISHNIACSGGLWITSAQGTSPPALCGKEFCDMLYLRFKSSYTAASILAHASASISASSPGCWIT